jgi:hypothetical protein
MTRTYLTCWSCGTPVRASRGGPTSIPVARIIILCTQQVSRHRNPADVARVVRETIRACCREPEYDAYCAALALAETEEVQAEVARQFLDLMIRKLRRWGAGTRRRCARP